MAEKSKPKSVIVGLQDSPVQIVDAPNQAIVYSNICAVGITAEELFFHFAARTSSVEATGVVKVFTSLPAAKRMLQALQTSIEQHETIFGEIDIDKVSSLSQDRLAELEKRREQNGS